MFASVGIARVTSRLHFGRFTWHERYRHWARLSFATSFDVEQIPSVPIGMQRLRPVKTLARILIYSATRYRSRSRALVINELGNRFPMDNAKSMRMSLPCGTKSSSAWGNTGLSSWRSLPSK